MARPFGVSYLQNFQAIHRNRSLLQPYEHLVLGSTKIFIFYQKRTETSIVEYTKFSNRHAHSDTKHTMYRHLNVARRDRDVFVRSVAIVHRTKQRSSAPFLHAQSASLSPIFTNTMELLVHTRINDVWILVVFFPVYRLNIFIFAYCPSKPGCQR